MECLADHRAMIRKEAASHITAFRLGAFKHILRQQIQPVTLEMGGKRVQVIGKSRQGDPTVFWGQHSVVWSWSHEWGGGGQI